MRFHESSKCHSESVLKIFTSPSTSQNVGEIFLTALKWEKLDRRHCFLKILSTIRFIACQGMALRRDRIEIDSNFIQLLRVRGEDDPKVLERLTKRKTNKYTSAEIHLCRNTPLQKYTSAEIHLCRNTPLQKYTSAEIHLCRNTPLQKYTSAEIHLCRNTPLQKYTSAEIHLCRNTPLQKYTSPEIHLCRNTPLQKCKMIFWVLKSF